VVLLIADSKDEYSLLFEGLCRLQTDEYGTSTGW